MSLATLLLESIEDEPELDPALLAELQQCATDLRSGKVKGLTTEAAYGFRCDEKLRAKNSPPITPAKSPPG